MNKQKYEKEVKLNLKEGNNQKSIYKQNKYLNLCKIAFIIILYIYIILSLFTCRIIKKLVNKKQITDLNKINKNYNETITELNQKYQNILDNYKSNPQLIQNYIYNCVNGGLLDTNKYNLSPNPKVSIVVVIYNHKNFIKTVLKSIQNQKLKEIEIIFVDDNSKDNSTKIIEYYQKEDKRIRLIKNEKNKGTWYTKYRGILEAKGEYIIVIDGDDIILEDGINIAYNYAKIKGLDLVKFNFITTDKNYKVDNLYIDKNISLNFYTNNEIIKYLPFQPAWTLLIKREIAVQSEKDLEKYCINEGIITSWEDQLLSHAVLKYSNSFLIINIPGYVWYQNPKSVLHNNSIKRANSEIKGCFITLKFLYDSLDNTEKGIAKKITHINFLFNNDFVKRFNEGFDKAYTVLDLYIKDERFPKNIRDKLINIKSEIQNRENK